MASTPELLRQIGAAIREARLARGLTLHAMSEKTALSRPFLSRLERGQVSTSIANLVAITGVLGIDLGKLFQGTAAPAASRGYVVAHRGKGRPTEIEATGYRYERVVDGWAGQKLDAFVLTFPLRNRADVRTAHEGEELLYVLKGRILFELGDEEIPLSAGDAIYFKSDIPHMGKNVGDVDAKVLMVTVPGRLPGRELGWWNAPAAPARRRRRRKPRRPRRQPRKESRACASWT
jgi:transcriptional regulator with XRE-family HTH domain